MRNYVPCWDKIGISRDRYLELLRFCRQYDEWKLRADSMIGIHGQSLDGQPHGNGMGDPVAAAAERRYTLLGKMALVEECAAGVSGGQWATALIMNICRGIPYAKIPAVVLPSSYRAAFFHARKEFFVLLDEKRK